MDASAIPLTLLVVAATLVRFIPYQSIVVPETFTRRSESCQDSRQVIASSCGPRWNAEAYTAVSGYFLHQSQVYHEHANAPKNSASRYFPAISASRDGKRWLNLAQLFVHLADEAKTSFAN